MKLRLLSLVLMILVAGVVPAFALADASAKALDAFRRYEPDFLTSLRKLEEIQRKIQNQNLKPGMPEHDALKEDAADLLDFVQRRYDLMDDLFKSVSGDYPADRAQLFDGFSRLDDLYRKFRDFYLTNFEDGQSGAPPAAKPAATAAAPARSQQPAAGQPAKPAPGAAVTAPAQETAPVAVVPSSSPSPATLDVPKVQESDKVKLTGSLKVDLRNKNEKYTAQNTALPNNYYQGKLSLAYQLDENDKLFLEDKYLQRRRNELVKENVLTFSWVHTHSPRTIYSFKDTLHHVWYPQNAQKAYRDNTAEIFLNRKEGRYERMYNLGYETRTYPDYSRSDFTQKNVMTQTTYFIQNGTLFGESTYNWREYKNSPNLDYRNENTYVEFQRSYGGNKSEISVSDTYDHRLFESEAINLFRASYWDNYFRFRYDLPVSKTWKWTFEDEHQRRHYPSDNPRGYAQLKIKTTGHITIDKKTRAKIGHAYIFNDEKTKARSHKNHQWMGMWEKKFTDRFKLKVEDTFHRRYTLIGDVMDFAENLFSMRATWKLPSKIELTWRGEYLARMYTAMFYRDYRYLQTGLQAAYAQPKKYDWSLEQAFRKFSNRNGNNIASDWRNQSQPFTEGKFNWFIRKDLKLKLTASREKTYYKSFDTTSQELLWDFTRPMTVTEFYGGLEYDF
ncbi:MAG: hypothetical protein GX442_05365 [Candidatus Riflebacteria bacterium]|nr:hypothetical protein [Candidatus Riflebacteria bacterium]